MQVLGAASRERGSYLVIFKVGSRHGVICRAWPFVLPVGVCVIARGFHSVKSSEKQTDDVLTDVRGRGFPVFVRGAERGRCPAGPARGAHGVAHGQAAQGGRSRSSAEGERAETDVCASGSPKSCPIRVLRHVLLEMSPGGFEPGEQDSYPGDSNIFPPLGCARASEVMLGDFGGS